jgi:hypothetical protein
MVLLGEASAVGVGGIEHRPSHGGCVPAGCTSLSPRPALGSVRVTPSATHAGTSEILTTGRYGPEGDRCVPEGAAPPQTV